MPTEIRRSEAFLARETQPFDRKRLLSVTLGTVSDLETRTKRNYYDADALHTVFPEDAREQMLDDTGGYTPDQLQQMNPGELSEWMDKRFGDDGEDVV